MAKMDNGIRYDMSQFYPIKALLERLFGNATYMRLKETGTLRDWKSALTKLLRAIGLSIETTVLVADQAWHEDVREILSVGLQQISAAKNIADAFASLSATLTKLVFTQIGLLPIRPAATNTVALVAPNWKLDGIRTVQYVQTAAQKSAGDRMADKQKKRLQSQAR
jgi:hypothetical protein